MIVMERGPEKCPPFVSNLRRFEWNSQKTIYRRVGNSGKQFCLLMEGNVSIWIR
jgi:hypothetical protein